MFLLLVLDWPTVRGVTFDVLFVVFKVHMRLRSASRGCATSGLFHEVGRSERQKSREMVSRERGTWDVGW